MKKSMNFRFSENTVLILALLERKLHLSKTAVLENALQYYSDKKLKSDNPLMRHAGTLSDDDAKEMLTAIKKDRRSKNIKVKL